MRDDSTRQSVLFSDLFGKQVVAQFDQPHASSDGGALLLKACDARLGLIDRLSPAWMTIGKRGRWRTRWRI